MNPLRGEYRIQVGDLTLEGKLNLTMLKALETALEAKSINDIGRKLSEPAADELAGAIAVVSNGKLTREEAADMPLGHAIHVLQAFGDVFAKSFEAPEGAEKAEKKPPTSRSRGATG